MGRLYQLSKNINEEEIAKIIGELQEDPNVKHVEIVDGDMKVFTNDDTYTEVMTKAVNICSRVAKLELSFQKFLYE